MSLQLGGLNCTLGKSCTETDQPKARNGVLRIAWQSYKDPSITLWSSRESNSASNLAGGRLPRISYPSNRESIMRMFLNYFQVYYFFTLCICVHINSIRRPGCLLPFRAARSARLLRITWMRSLLCSRATTIQKTCTTMVIHAKAILLPLGI